MADTYEITARISRAYRILGYTTEDQQKEYKELVTSALVSASSHLAARCLRDSFVLRDYTQTFYPYYTTDIWLNHPPVTAIKSVKVNGVAQSLTDYELVDSRLLYYSDGFTEAQRVQITWTAGYSNDKWDSLDDWELWTVPTDLEEATIQVLSELAVDSLDSYGNKRLQIGTIKYGPNGDQTTYVTARNQYVDAVVRKYKQRR